jgi:enamine deaminase RidA (YjgF/YER057c/UK114 family)
MDIDAKLRELGYGLPSVAKPIASYVPAVEANGQVLVSGQLPVVDGELIARGKVPSEVSLEQAQAAARQCVLNGLAAIDQVLAGDWSRLERLSRLAVHVNSDANFDAQHKVANGASELIGQVLGDAGIHARAAVGAAALPLQAPVEVELVAAVR